MNENTKILSIIAAVLAVIILFYEVRERKAQAQEGGTDIRIQDDKVDVTIPQGKTEIKEDAQDDKIEISPDQAPPKQPQRKLLPRSLQQRRQMQSQCQPQIQPQYQMQPQMQPQYQMQPYPCQPMQQGGYNPCQPQPQGCW